MAPARPTELGEAAGRAHSERQPIAEIGDGAALCILTTRKRAEAEGFEILGKYVASTFVGVFFFIPIWNV